MRSSLPLADDMPPPQAATTEPHFATVELINFIAALTFYATLPALILGRSGGNEFALAVVQSTLGGAAVVGSLFAGLWGGPSRKIHCVLLGAGCSFLLGDLLLRVGRTLPH